MKLTPLDIHHKEFRRSIRGYNEEDVDVFLDQVAEEFERLFKENTELKERVENMSDKVKQYEGVEQTLQKALFTGQQAADQVKENAQKESELIVGDAEKKAKDIIQDVRKEKAVVVAELKRLREAEDRFRADFKEILNAFLVESDELKVPGLSQEAEEALAAAPEPEEPEAPADEPISAPEADAPAEPEIDADEEPKEPAALNIDAAGAGVSQVPVVMAEPESPAMSDISQAGLTYPGSATPVEPPTEPTASTEPAASTEPVASTEPTASTEPAASTEPTASTEPAASTEPVAPVTEDETHQATDAIGSPTSADVSGNFFSTPHSSEEEVEKVPEVPEPTKTDYFQESPQAPDIGAGGSVEEKIRPADDNVEQSADAQPTSEFKITLGAPVHETPGESPTSEPGGSGMPADVLVDLKNQEVPEFDPTAKKEGDTDLTRSDDVVSSFFDDDLGGDD